MVVVILVMVVLVMVVLVMVVLVVVCIALFSTAHVASAYTTSLVSCCEVSLAGAGQYDLMGHRDNERELQSCIYFDLKRATSYAVSGRHLDNFGKCVEGT